MSESETVWFWCGRCGWSGQIYAYAVEDAWSAVERHREWDGPWCRVAARFQ